MNRTSVTPGHGPLSQQMAVAFLVSGSAGLIHEVVWARLLGHLFGATFLAVNTVLAPFMGGLATGSYWIGRPRLGALPSGPGLP